MDKPTRDKLGLSTAPRSALNQHRAFKEEKEENDKFDVERAEREAYNIALLLAFGMCFIVGLIGVLLICNHINIPK